ncbi:hypothetical protein Hanom_Chr06g00579061 [Helianthus anomalus]
MGISRDSMQEESLVINDFIATKQVVANIANQEHRWCTASINRRRKVTGKIVRRDGRNRRVLKKNNLI